MRIAQNIIVTVDKNQNKELVLGNESIVTARNYSQNWREKNPSVAKVIEGNDNFRAGQYILCHFNLFEWNSAYILSEENNIETHAIPDNDMILGVINNEGELSLINGNIFVERTYNPTLLEIPKDLAKPSINKVIVEKDGEGYHKGDIVFTYDFGIYETFYVWNNEEKRAAKINTEDIVGVIRN